MRDWSRLPDAAPDVIVAWDGRSAGTDAEGKKLAPEVGGQVHQVGPGTDAGGARARYLDICTEMATNREPPPGSVVLVKSGDVTEFAGAYCEVLAALSTVIHCGYGVVIGARRFNSAGEDDLADLSAAVLGFEAATSK